MEKKYANLNGEGLVVFVSAEAEFRLEWVLVLVLSRVDVARRKRFIRRQVRVFPFQRLLRCRAIVHASHHFRADGRA